MFRLNNLQRNSSLIEGIDPKRANWTTVSWDALKKTQIFYRMNGNLRTRTINSSAFSFNQIRDCWLPVVLEIILIIFALPNCKTKKSLIELNSRCD